jgi:hypothetical protein
MALSPALMSWRLSWLWALMAALALVGNLYFVKVIRSWVPWPGGVPVP